MNPAVYRWVFVVLLISANPANAFWGEIIGGVIAVVAAPVALPMIGFTGAGITAGSIGASMMASYGGAVTAGSVVAVAQSIGVAGFASKSIGAVASGGATIGGFIEKKLRNE